MNSTGDLSVPAQGHTVCRFAPPDGPPSVGLMTPEGALLDLARAGCASLTAILERDDAPEWLQETSRRVLPSHALEQVRLLPPVERQEVWAAGVTYLRSKKARMEESEFGANAYDRVYEADRPELFFKAQAQRVAGPGEPVGVRHDSRWTVPEPELALVLNSRGNLAGYTIGNDMSARDLEGENLLYLPQAKIYDGSCALGPWIVVGPTETDARQWSIGVEIRRGERTAFAGETQVGRIKRGFDELAGWLFRCQTLREGAVLLTGTGVVPPDDFRLEPGDAVCVSVSGIGRLLNPVRAV